MAERPEGTICLEELRRRIARLEAPRRQSGEAPLRSGCEAVDELLPEGGFRRGSLVEWLSAGEGIGAGTLALLAARAAMYSAHSVCGKGSGGGAEEGRVLAVLDPGGEFCPTAAVRLGIGPEQLLVIQPRSAADEHWAIDQVLRSPAVGAVLAWPGAIDARTFRRWQLAAEEGGTLGLLLRPAGARPEPSWAEVRLLVEPIAPSNRCDFAGGDSCRRLAELRANYSQTSAAAAARLSATGVASYRDSDRRPLRITLLRCRGGTAGRSVEVELDDETNRVYPLEQRRLQIAAV